jgi:hypothetical protein
MLAWTVSAQTQPPLKLLVSDQTPLPLANTFDEAWASDINRNGDYVFRTDLALFFRPAGASAPIRLLQAGDALPGYPGNRCDIFQGLHINASGRVAFTVDSAPPTGQIRNALLTYAAGVFQNIAYSTDIAPGGGSYPYGRNLSLIGINDANDVAFTANLQVTIGIDPARPTLFIAPGGGPVVRLVGFGDTLPGMTGTLTGISSTSLNNRGEVSFRANTSTGAWGLFVASTSGVRKVAAQGDPIPGGKLRQPLDGSGEPSWAGGVSLDQCHLAGHTRTRPHACRGRGRGHAFGGHFWNQLSAGGAQRFRDRRFCRKRLAGQLRLRAVPRQFGAADTDSCAPQSAGAWNRAELYQ